MLKYFELDDIFAEKNGYDKKQIPVVFIAQYQNYHFADIQTFSIGTADLNVKKQRCLILYNDFLYYLKENIAFGFYDEENKQQQKQKRRDIFKTKIYEDLWIKAMAEFYGKTEKKIIDEYNKFAEKEYKKTLFNDDFVEDDLQKLLIKTDKPKQRRKTKKKTVDNKIDNKMLQLEEIDTKKID